MAKKETWIRVCDKLPTFCGLYKVRYKSGKIEDAFFKHYATEASWRAHVEEWCEYNDID